MIKSFINKNILTIVGVAAGAVIGYLHYSNIGCENGSCSITSSPVNSTLYGMLMGGLFFNLFQDILKTRKREN